MWRFDGAHPDRCKNPAGGGVSFDAHRAVGVAIVIVTPVIMEVTTSLTIAILTCGFLLLGAVFLSSPTLAVLMYVATRPLADAYVYSRASLFGHSAAVGQIWGAGLLAVLAVFLVRRRKKLWRRGYLLPAALVVAYAASTASRAGTHFAAVAGARLLTWLALILVAESIAHTEVGQRAIFVAASTAATLLVVVVALRIAQNRYGSAYYNPARNHLFVGSSAIYQAPYVYSAFACFTLPFVLGLVLGRRLTPLSELLSLALVIGIVLSLVRASYIGLAVLGVAFVVAAARLRDPRVIVQNRRAAIALAIAGVGVAASLAVFLGGTIAHRLSHGSGRLRRWHVIFDATLHNSHTRWIGGGAAFSRAVWEHATGESNWSHNDFLELFATGGPFLVVLYLALLSWIAHGLIRLYRDRRLPGRTRSFVIVAAGGFAAFCAISFVDGIIFSTASIMLGLMVGLVRGMSYAPDRAWINSASLCRRSLIPRLDSAPKVSDVKPCPIVLGRDKTST